MVGQKTGNANLHLNSVSVSRQTMQNLMDETRKSFNMFNKQLEQLINQLSILKEKVKKNPTEIKKFFVDKYRPIQDILILAEQSQKQQNKQAQENMTEIKRENRQTSESIVKTFQKLKSLQVKIGFYA